MKRFEVSFILETEDDVELGDIALDLDRLLEDWISESEDRVLRAFGRDVEISDD